MSERKVETPLYTGPKDLPSVTGGAEDLKVERKTAQTTIVAGRVGVGETLSGTTTFLIKTGKRYWHPDKTYFQLTTHWTNGDDTQALPYNSGIAHAENMPAMLFTTVEAQLEQEVVETTRNVPQVDTIATVCSTDIGWKRTIGTASGWGSWGQRSIAVSGAAGSTVKERARRQVFTFRPPLSLFNHASGLLGGEWRITFTWSTTPEQNCLGECPRVVGATLPPRAGVDFQVFVDSFVMQLCTSAPAATSKVESTFLIPLTPMMATPIAVSTDSLDCNVPVPASTFRLLFAHQDPGKAGKIVAGSLLTNGVAATFAAGVPTSVGSGNCLAPKMSVPLTWFPDVGAVGLLTSETPSGLTEFSITSEALPSPWPAPGYSALNTLASSAAQVYRDFIETTTGDNMRGGTLEYGNADVSVTPPDAWPQVVIAGAAAGAAALMPSSARAFAATGAVADFTGMGPPTPKSEITSLSGHLGKYYIIAAPIVTRKGAALSRIQIIARYGTSMNRTMWVFAVSTAACGYVVNADGSLKIEMSRTA